MSERHEVIIIGSGPAGYTAAVYAARANLEPLLFEGEPRPEAPDLLPGGQLMLTTDVENYPGFPDGVTGPDMMALFRQQAERFGTDIRMLNVEEVDFSGPPHRVRTSDGEWHSANAIIVSTGASARWLGLESETKLRNRGVSACATCDGAFFKGQEMVVVGGGDSAMEEAIFLTRFASKVHVVHRREALRASKIMQQRALDNEKIDFLWNSVVEEVLGVDQGRVTGVRLRNVETDEEAEQSCGAVFVAIGHQPNTGFLKGALPLDEQGYVKVERGTHTAVEGVFACGDVSDKIYRQAVTAAGMGCMAAIDAERWLEAYGAKIAS